MDYARDGSPDQSSRLSEEPQVHEFLRSLHLSELAARLLDLTITADDLVLAYPALAAADIALGIEFTAAAAGVLAFASVAAAMAAAGLIVGATLLVIDALSSSAKVSSDEESLALSLSNPVTLAGALLGSLLSSDHRAGLQWGIAVGERISVGGSILGLRRDWHELGPLARSHAAINAAAKIVAFGNAHSGPVVDTFLSSATHLTPLRQSSTAHAAPAADAFGSNFTVPERLDVRSSDVRSPEFLNSAIYRESAFMNPNTKYVLDPSVATYMYSAETPTQPLPPATLAPLPQATPQQPVPQVTPRSSPVNAFQSQPTSPINQMIPSWVSGSGFEGDVGSPRYDDDLPLLLSPEPSPLPSQLHPDSGALLAPRDLL